MKRGGGGERVLEGCTTPPTKTKDLLSVTLCVGRTARRVPCRRAGVYLFRKNRIYTCLVERKKFGVRSACQVPHFVSKLYRTQRDIPMSSFLCRLPAMGNITSKCLLLQPARNLKRTTILKVRDERAGGVLINRSSPLTPHPWNVFLVKAFLLAGKILLSSDHMYREVPLSIAVACRPSKSVNPPRGL